MKTTIELKELFASGENDGLLKDIYVDEALLDYQRKRYVDAISRYEELYGSGEVEIYSAPGRSEIGGNHTDHQNGEVLAASINLDAIGIVGKLDGVVKVVSGTADMIEIDLNDISHTVLLPCSLRRSVLSFLLCFLIITYPPASQATPF